MRDEARRGVRASSTRTPASPYLFHLARVSVVRARPPPVAPAVCGAYGPPVATGSLTRLSRAGWSACGRSGVGAVAPCPLEHLLLLRGARNVAPGSVPLARNRGVGWRTKPAIGCGTKQLVRLVDEHRARIEQSLPERLEWVARGWDHKAAELNR